MYQNNMKRANISHKLNYCFVLGKVTANDRSLLITGIKIYLNIFW